MHPLKEVNMIVAKMDLLAKRLENYEKMSTQETMQAMESHMTCEVCGESGHSGLIVLKLMKTSTYNNDNGCHPLNQGWNQRSNTQGNNYNTNYSQCLSNQGNGYPFLKDLIYSQGRMTGSINKKLYANDKMLENIDIKWKISHLL
jgi:hypothetical protein